MKNFEAAAQREKKDKALGKRPAHQPAHISFLAYYVNYVFP